MKRARNTERRSWLKHDTDEHPGDPGAGAERAANAVDRYALALQLIQVFPVVSQAAIFIFATTWFARALSGSCLLLGTVWVVYLERNRLRRPADAQDTGVGADGKGGTDSHTLTLGLTDVPEDMMAQVAQVVESAVLPSRMPAVTGAEGPAAQDEQVLHTEVTHHDGRIHIAISLHLRPPEPPPARPRHGVGTRRQIRHRSFQASSASLERSERGGAVSPDGATPFL